MRESAAQKHGMMVTASVAAAVAASASQHLYNLHNGKENACCADTDTTVADTCSTLLSVHAPNTYERERLAGGVARRGVWVVELQIHF